METYVTKIKKKVVLLETRCMRQGDFGIEYSAFQLKFVFEKIMCLSFVYCPQLEFF